MTPLFRDAITLFCATTALHASFHLPEIKKSFSVFAMHLTHLNALRALEATLRHGSFTEAAEELGITPAAVGQRVRSLEEYLGQSLFTRSSAGIEPTEAALGVAGHLTAGFGEVAQALEGLSRHKRPDALRVTLPESFSENWLAPILSEFHLANPRLELQLEPSNRDENLLAGGFDLAIRYGAQSDDQLEETVLFGDLVIPVCSPRFMQQHGLSAELRSLKGIPLIHVIHRTKDPGWVGFDKWGREFGFDAGHLGHGIRFSRSGSGLQAAAAGQGLVLCGIVEAFNLLRSGALVLPFGPAVGFRTSYAYRLVRVKGRAKSPAQRKFSGWLLSKAEEFKAELEALLGRPV